MNIVANLRRDWVTINGLRKTLKNLDGIGLDSELLVPDDFEAVIDKYRSNVAWRFEDEIVTYGEMEARANKIAHWALAQGLKPGDCVALFMGNRPDYVAVWFGLSKVAVVTAMINHNLEDKALAHCVNISGAKHVICGPDHGAPADAAAAMFDDAPELWAFGGTREGTSDFEVALAAMSAERPDRSHRADQRGRDICLYVYTSGTTGMPKAAKLNHARTQTMLKSFVAATRTTPADRVYVTLPLYHGTGGICGIGVALMTGASVILRRKFSASKFWDDAVDYEATRIVYIGELCRYLLNQPPHPKETAHRIKSGFGNGLRPDIWQDFLDRFNIPGLCEFYGSTEGNVSFLNFDGKVGTVGRIPKLLEKEFTNIRFVKFDIAEEEPVRGEDGFCMDTNPDEAGEVLGLLSGPNARGTFEGYNDAAATQKKIMHDVFETGDSWFRTGDLMRKDADGYIYFVDRIGDTFRWKGENVATNEVAEVLSQYNGVATCNVYGVQVPGTDGRAGMAAITTSGEVDYDGLHAWLAERLPAYAMPVFIRVQPVVEDTGTPVQVPKGRAGARGL